MSDTTDMKVYDYNDYNDYNIQRHDSPNRITDEHMKNIFDNTVLSEEDITYIMSLYDKFKDRPLVEKKLRDLRYNPYYVSEFFNKDKIKAEYMLKYNDNFVIIAEMMLYHQAIAKLAELSKGYIDASEI